MKKVLIVGAGPTGALLAYNIKNSSKLRKVVDLHVWDKARGCGGRFSTSRSSFNDDLKADLGAQYLTCNSANKLGVDSKPYIDSLLRSGIIDYIDTSKMATFKNDQGRKNYVSRNGTASIVKHFFTEAGMPVDKIQFNVKVSEIRKATVDGREMLMAIPENQSGCEGGTYVCDTFDAVVSTIPIPQVLQLDEIGSLLKGSEEIKKNLENVKYTCRYALGIFYKNQIPLEDSDAFHFIDNGNIRYWSHENLKRAAGLRDNVCGPTAITVHTSTEFGALHLEDTPASMKETLEEQVKEKLIFLQEHKPAEVKCHKWKYSQVQDCYAGSPGAVVLFSNPSLVIAGDGMSGSGFEGCIHSAIKTSALLEQCIH